MSTAERPTPNTGAADPTPNLDDLIRPEDLRHIKEEHELTRAKEAMEHDKKRQEEQDAVREAFFNQHVRSDAKERFTRAVRAAAEGGVNEIQIARFHSRYCADLGRAINNFDPDWPSSLTGYAREAYDIYEKHLKDKGYQMRAQILDYPGGMPGDVGLFLSW